jgi:hypothetical protein
MTKKRWLVLGSGLGIVAGAAWGVHRFAPATTERTGAKETSACLRPSQPGCSLGRRRCTSHEGALGDPSPSAWAELVSRYPGSDDATKRLVLERISKLERFERMLEYVLATVGEDPTPAEDDPMVDEAGELIEHRVKNACRLRLCAPQDGHAKDRQAALGRGETPSPSSRKTSGQAVPLRRSRVSSLPSSSMCIPRRQTRSSKVRSSTP